MSFIISKGFQALVHALSYINLDIVAIKAPPTPNPPISVGKSLFTMGDACIMKIIAIMEIAQIPTLTIASMYIECIILSSSLFSVTI